VSKQEREYGLQLPTEDDSVANGDGLTQLNSLMESLDYQLGSVDNSYTPGPNRFIGKWHSAVATQPNVANAAPIVEINGAWVNDWTVGTVGAVTFDLATGRFTFGTGGIYKVHIAASIIVSVVPTKGQFTYGLTKVGSGVFLPKLWKQVSLENAVSQNRDSFGFPILVGAGGDILTTDSVTLGMSQQNDTTTMGNAASDNYIEIEYVRPT
jgi:hypothetical protein